MSKVKPLLCLNTDYYVSRLLERYLYIHKYRLNFLFTNDKYIDIHIAKKESEWEFFINDFLCRFVEINTNGINDIVDINGFVMIPDVKRKTITIKYGNTTVLITDCFVSSDRKISLMSRRIDSHLRHHFNRFFHRNLDLRLYIDSSYLHNI